MKKIKLILIALTITSAKFYAQVPSYVPTNGLVGWWPFNGNANDESGNSNNGAVNGATLTTDRFGVANKAYSFDGINDYISGTISNLTNTSITSLSAWLKYTGNAGGQPYDLFFQYGAYGNHTFAYGYNYFNQNIDFYSQCFSNPYSSVNLQNSWHHLVIVDSLQYTKIYIDGVLFYNSSSAGTGNCYQGSNSFLIGGGADNQYTTGSLDDIGIWNRALTPSEITALYTSTYPPSPPTLAVSPVATTICAGSSTTLSATANAGSTVCASSQLPTGLQSGLVGYWPFCGNANDASGNGNNGTVNGATLTTDRFGNASSAYSFDGVNDYIEIPYSSLFINGQLTISYWKKDSTLTNDTDLMFGNPTSAIWCTQVGPNFVGMYNNLGCNGYDAGLTTSNFINNSWSLISFVINNNSTSLYKNGNYIGSWNSSIISNSNCNSTTYKLYLGVDIWSSSEFYKFKLDDIAIWNRVLTATEVQELYTLGQATYSWSPGGATTPSITVSPTATTTYTCTATANGVSSTATSIVTVAPAPTITSTNTTICAGQSTTLTASTTSTGTGSNCPTLSGTLTTGLVGYWPFCGNANDASGNGNNGTVNGATLTTDRFGNNSNALNLDGVDDYLSLDNQLPDCSVFTISLWAYHTKGASFSGILSDATTSSGNDLYFNLNESSIGIKADKNGTSLFQCPLPEVGYNPAPISSGLNLGNQWSHISLIVESNLTRVYVNSSLVATLNIGGSNVGFHALHPVFGKITDGDYSIQYFGGKLDDIGIWNRALTAAEIQQLYTMGQTTYAWSPGGAISPSITVTPATTTTYTYTVTTNGLSCPASQTITVNPLPSATISQNGSTSFCQGGSVQLCAPTGTGLTYSWSGNLGTTSCITVASSQTTAVTVTNASGCSATSAPQSVVVLGNPIANAGLDGTITCVQNAAGYQIGSTPNPTITYSWTPTTGLSNPNIANPIANPSSTTTYTLTIVNADGCTGSDQVVVTVNNTIPLANAGIDFTKTCVSNVSGATVGMTAVSGNTYSWTPTAGLSSSTVANPTANPSATTSYTLTTTNTANGCTANDQVVVTVNTAIPSVDAGLDFTKTCVSNVSGATVGMTTVSGNTYSWTPTAGLSSSTVANPTANPSATTTYTLTTTNTTNGCTANDQVVVIVNTTPPTINAGIDQSICLGQSVTFNASTNAPNLNWNNSVQNNIPFVPNSVGSFTYIASATGSNGCTANDEAILTVNALPIAQAGLDGLITCSSNPNGASLGSNPITGETYSWTPTSGLSNATIANPIANPVSNTIYTITTTNSFGCSAIDSVFISVDNDAPILDAGNDQNICSGDSLLLLASTVSGSTITWNGNVANGSYVLPATSSYYFATALATNGCSSVDSILVNILQPTSSILNETACDEFTLNGNTYNQSGTYTQVITNSAGCDSTITLNLNIIPSPTTPVVYVQNEVNLSTDIVPGLTYQWMFCSDLIPVPGATNPSFTPTANAFYAVIVSNTCGSDTSDCAEVSTIGLDEMNSNVILVYPNPNNGEFTIEITADELGQQLSIIDINGRSIKMIQLDELVLEIEIQELARGTYWLQIGRQKPIQIVKN